VKIFAYEVNTFCINKKRFALF